MRSLNLIVLIFLVLSFGLIPARAQDAPSQPLVVFVLDQTLQTASVSDPRPGGVSRLGDIFTALGARTTTITFDQPIPKEAQIVVLVRPVRQLSVLALGRLWTHLSRGGSVLIAVDPLGHENISPERASSGLSRLFGTDYGISLMDTFVTEPWFTMASIGPQNTSYSRMVADPVSNPVTAPLATYGIPVQVWGARSMQVEPVGISSNAVPLLRATSGYAEAGKIFDTKNEPAPLEFTEGEDQTGLLNVAAMAENTATGSRIAVLGDSEMLLNQYGLGAAPNGVDPIYLGDYLLAQRIAAWLLKLPVEQWPALPAGYTWLALDGDGSDWATINSTAAEDAVGDGPTPGSDLKVVHTVQNDDFLYLLIETDGAPDPAVDIQITMDSTTLVVHGNGGVEQVGGDAPITVPDGRMVAGSAFEVRLPLRMTGKTIDQLCLIRPDPASPPLDCLDSTVAPSVLAERAPSDLLFPDGPVATVVGNSTVNLRSGPSANDTILAQLESGRMLVVLGRNEVGDWLQVENARYSGWISTSLVAVNASIDALPVIAAQP